MKKEMPHGTHTAYGYHKCRCEICRKFNADYKYPLNIRDMDKYNPPTEETILARSIASPPYWKFNGHGFKPLTPHPCKTK